MKSKTVKNFHYEGLGFPIELEDVEMVNINGEWAPKIDIQRIADEAIKKLAIQETRLTGNQVKFIRSYFSMPLREFSKKVLHTTHSAVNKWEKAGDDVTKMNENTEQVLRLFIIEQTQAKTKNQQADFYEHFMESKRFYNAKNVGQKEPQPLLISVVNQGL